LENAVRKQLIQRSFNAISQGYDLPALRFFSDGAVCLAMDLEIKGDEQVLDLATGTGAVAVEIASRLKTGGVLGVDFSKGMLRRAEEKARDLGIKNVNFQQQDIDQLNLPEQAFDVISMGFGLFFFPDMSATLKKAIRHLKPSGRLGLSAFSTDTFSPLVDIFQNDLQTFNISGLEPSWKRLGEEGTILKVFRDAGISEPTINHYDCSFFLNSELDWWQVVWNSGLRGLVDQLEASQLSQFKKTHLANIAKRQQEQGVQLKVNIMTCCLSYQP